MFLLSLGRRVVGVMVALGLGSLTACSGAEPGVEPAPSSSASTPPAPPAPPCTPSPASEEKVTVRNEHGALEGTLVVPEGCGPFPVVLVIADSGPTDRDGNKPKTYRHLADELSARGVASLRYDKGGVGASAKAIGPVDEMTFEMGATDAALFVTALRGDARFSRLTIAGHSEGSLIAMLVAKRVQVDGFASLAGAGRPVGVVLREQLARNIRDAALLSRAREIIAALERGERVTDVPNELLELFHPNVQGYFISWMKYEPSAELKSAPFGKVLVAQGTTDVQISLEDANLLAGARPDAKLLVVENMSHTLKEARGTAAKDQTASYNDPSLPIVPELADAVATFARVP